MPFVRSSVLIALISFPAAAYVVDAVTVRAATPALVTVADSIVRQPSDAVVTFALAEVLQAQSVPQLDLPRDPPSTTTRPRRDSRPPLVVSVPAFRMPRAPSMVDALGRDALAEILANTVDTRYAPLVRDNQSGALASPDAPARQSLLEVTRTDGDPDPDRFYELKDLEEVPELLNGVVAEYPPLLASQGIEGFVTVRFAINSSGQTDSIQVLDATDRRFEQPAREAIQRSRYRPGRISGLSVRTMVEQRFTFGGASSDLAQPGALLATVPDDSTAVDQSQVYNPGDIDQPPELETGATPRYPQVLWDMGVDGFVDVEFVIGLSGQAERSSINITFSSDWRFEQPAMDAVRLSVYRPGRLRSTPVRVQAQQRVTFKRQ